MAAINLGYVLGRAWLFSGQNVPEQARIEKLVEENLDWTNIKRALIETPDDLIPRRGRTVIDGGKPEDESLVMQAVTLALEQSGGVHAANLAGDTALHGVVLLGFDTVVQFLADKGADLNVKNKRGLTPLASLTKGGRGRRGGAANDDYEPSVAKTSTVTLLRKLGGVD